MVCRNSAQVSSVQLLSCIRLFATPLTAARQASLSITNSHSRLKLMSIVSLMPSNHLILCRPLVLPPSISPCIRVFSKQSVLLLEKVKKKKRKEKTVPHDPSFIQHIHYQACNCDKLAIYTNSIE